VIRSLSANQPGFREVTLHDGFNLILADSTEASTEKDSRNGVGKTLFLEALHFCLGSSSQRKNGVIRPEFKGWEFTLSLDLGEREIEVTRAVDAPGSVRVKGAFDHWPVQPAHNEKTGDYELRLSEWTRVLGHEMLGLTPMQDEERYRPSFRMLIPYFARVGPGAFETPFKHFAGQREWQKQVAVTYLLGLPWDTASRWQVLKDQEEALKRLKSAMESGVLGETLGSEGQLKARRVAVQSKIDEADEELRTFEVHPQYTEIADEVNDLTARIHELVNGVVLRRRKIELYEDRSAQEKEPDVSEVEALFEEAGVELGGSVRRTLDDARRFHEAVVSNRHTYLADEVERLRRLTADAEPEIEQLSEHRAQRLQILETHRALDELVELQRRVAEMREELADLGARIARIEEVKEGQSKLAIEREELLRSARRELVDREPEWSTAVRLFAHNTEALYGTAGELVVEVEPSGFRFDIHIPRAGSRGVTNMSIFAFDLMLAQRWSDEDHSPGFLAHDSEVFDGVDERQVGAALKLAHDEAAGRGFQYICSLNTDAVPPKQFLDGLELEPVIRFTDSTPEGALFGFRWD